MTRTRCMLLLAALCLRGPDLFAASPPTIKLVRIGLPAGRSGEAGRSRNGAWAPVAVTLTAGSAGHPQDAYQLRIETTDLEDLSYQYAAAVPAMAANSERTVQGYIVPGSDSSLFNVRVVSADGQSVDAKTKISRDSNPGREEVVGDQDILFLAAGGGLAPLRRAAEALDKPEGKEEVDSAQGRRQFAFADDAGVLPDRWFGYDAVDVVVLATGKVDFVNQLAQDAERREALLEWVRRGGQLIISVGRNQQAVAGLLKRVGLIDVKITGSAVVPELSVLSRDWLQRGPGKSLLQQVETATLKHGPGVHVLVREASGPLVVQSSCGLGRVVLVGFDLDTAPFLTWDGQEAFWTEMQKLVAPYLPLRRGKGADRPVMAQPGMPPGARLPGMPGDGSDYDMRAELKRGLESFEEVPVISFGWVALFILFYIALVGPLDYFLLKKVFKRLELTWITFPLTVIGVSAIAYVVAYRVKGDDLRINKLDLIDVDMHQPRQAYGHSWFTLFSPRAQSYTVGIEPAVGTWTAAVPARAPGPVVTLLEGGDRTPRAGSQGLFGRPYEYAEDATGLIRVPVPVWSTRSFTASWRAPLIAKKPPVGITDEIGPIRTSRDGPGLVGRLTNHLPSVLKDVCLFYENHWYYLGDMAPDEQRRIEPYFARDAQGQRRPISAWFDDSTLAPGVPTAPSGRPINVGFLQNRTSYTIIKPMLFYRLANRAGTNAGLRPFDQSWRLEEQREYPEKDRRPFRHELILVARTPMLCDHAEQVTEDGATPARLWLGELPGPERTRPTLRGVITQETFLRVFIPVVREP